MEGKDNFALRLRANTVPDRVIPVASNANNLVAIAPGTASVLSRNYRLTDACASHLSLLACFQLASLGGGRMD